MVEKSKMTSLASLVVYCHLHTRPSQTRKRQNRAFSVKTRENNIPQRFFPGNERFFLSFSSLDGLPSRMKASKKRRWAFSFLISCLSCGCFDWFFTTEAACLPPSGCGAALAYYKASSGDTLDGISKRFQTDVRNVQKFNDLPQPNNISENEILYIPFHCLCSANHLGFTILYEVQPGDLYGQPDGLVQHIVNVKFDRLSKQEWIVRATPLSDPETIFPGFVLKVPLNCSCGNPNIGDSGLFTTYAVQPNDTLAAISTKFNVPQEQIVQYNNGIDWVKFQPQEDIVFLPFPGRQRDEYLFNTSSLGSDGGVNTAAIVGGSIGGGFALLTMAALGVFFLFIFLPTKDQGRDRKDQPPVLAILQAGSSIDDGRKQGISRQSSEGISTAGSSPAYLSEFVADKSVEFSYEELAAATSNFSESKKIGEGGYGAVYYGVLRGQNVAIKRMDLQATREFLSELKVLTRVHHRNLVQLFGYCTVDSLFLVYEFVEKGTLSQHLHGAGLPTLCWARRVQIALDAARGLEYIHDHTKPSYVHRDVKPSNILIDKNFRAKVADFGLTNLHESGVASFSMTMPTRLVGTFGYMPPEYARFGEVSPEVDIYSFGVVLFEMISAKEAIVKTGSESSTSSGCNQEQTGLVTLFESVLNHPDGKEKIRSLVDPALEEDYPLDSVWKMAQLAGACTLENPLLRPKMRTLVVALMTLSPSTQDWEPRDYARHQNFGILVS